MPIRDFVLKARALFGRRSAERELRDELEFHIEMQSRKHIEAGMGPAEARRRARAEFGSVELAKDDARDVRDFHWFEDFRQDVRIAVRGFVRAPLFALTVILTISIGLGLNTAVFTAFDAYVLRPFAVRDPLALFDFVWRDNRGSAHALTWPQYRMLRDENPAFSESFAYLNMVTRVDGGPVFGQFVSGNYFTMLGVGPALGRTLLPEDAAATGGGAVTVLSYAAWQGRYAGDSGIIGRTVQVRGVPLVVVGVARDGFGGLETRARDLWIPLTMAASLGAPDPLDPAHPAPLQVIGRLRPDISERSARAALTAWARAAVTDRPERERAVGTSLVPRETAVPLVGETVLIFAPIVVAFSLVLLLACANVANMMLARGMARQREMGICLSLGASRGRLVRQLLTECLILAVPAAVLGFLISSLSLGAGVRLIFAAVPRELAPMLRLVPLQSDTRVLAFMIVAAVASAVFFGLAPALQATRPSVVQAARGNFDNALRPSRLRSALVVAQITICVVLIAAAGIMLRSSVRLQHTDPGMRTHDVVDLQIQDSRRVAVVAALRVHPLVDIVSSAANTPVDRIFGSVPLLPSGGAGLTRTSFNVVSPEYFRLLEMPILRGRNFLPNESVDSLPVTIVTESTARRLWGTADPLGQLIHLDMGKMGRGGAFLEAYKNARVVGVVRDVVAGVLYDPATEPLVFFPGNPEQKGARILVRVRGDAEIARRTIEADIDRSSPGAIDQIHKIDEFIAGQAFPMRIAYWISSAVGVIALLLTLSGIYGVLSYLVAQRTKEIGIRISLGADGSAVVRLVLRESMRLALIGLGVGSLLALGVTRLIASELQAILTFDLAAFSIGPLAVLTASLVAAYFPARRATRIDPLIALRQD